MSRPTRPRDPRKLTKAQLVAENARLRRALARRGAALGAGETRTATRAARDAGAPGELQARDHLLAEALERQIATAEILRAISRSPTELAPVFDVVVTSAARLCEAADVALLLVEDGDLRIAGGVGPLHASLPADFRFRLTRGSAAARAAVDRAPVHIHDFTAEPEDEFPVGRELARRFGHRTMLAVPLLREDMSIGVICAFRFEVRPFPEPQIALLETFADHAVIAIENVRLFEQLQGKNRDLTEALERQTATSGILRVISQSRTDVRAVFDAIALSAQRLCGALQGNVFTFDGELIHLAAAVNVNPEGVDELGRMFPRRVDRASATTRAILTCAPVLIPDVREDPEFQLSELARIESFRSALSVPMLREGRPIGAITVTRAAPGPFPDKQVALLETFAAQAVIAIENVRLFTELERSVGHLTALGEVGQAVSSSLDLETVLNTIVSRAVEISGLDGGTVFEYDEEAQEFVQRVAIGIARRIGHAVIRKGEGVVGRTAITHEPVQVPDIMVSGSYESHLRESLLDSGVRGLLAVPMLREGHLVGGLAVNRKRPGEFPPETVDMLRTFATQSALAIQNARLYRQLDTANRHKSAFLASMSHELRTPLNAIIGYSEMLQEEAADLGQPGLVPDLGKINIAGKHLLELINTVLDLSKIEAGKMEVYHERFPVAALVEEVGALIRPLADRRQNRFATSCDLAIEMRGDQTKVRQVLFNLLSNACKFTEAGTVSLVVRRDPAAADHAAGVIFDVADTGIGMTAEELGRLFQEFAQAHATTARRYGGTGLGLALSRRLCRLMGGDIAVTSEPGRGSTFTVRLPVDGHDAASPPAHDGDSRQAGEEVARP